MAACQRLQKVRLQQQIGAVFFRLGSWVARWPCATVGVALAMVALLCLGTWSPAQIVVGSTRTPLQPPTVALM